MNILHQNATSILLERVKDLKPGNHCSSWRSIHIHLSDKPERYNHGLRAYFIARALIDRLADHDGYLFLCEDGDIFLLFQGPMKPILKKLESHFEDIEADLSGASEDSRFTVYDIGADWQALHALCRRKAFAALTAPEGFYTAFAYSLDEVRA